ncbi:MAG: TRAP transporter large permease [Desulfobulbaceae bacterium]|nr:TRAP transporter large permease [Desulfobulbaceae bacterium]
MGPLLLISFLFLVALGVPIGYTLGIVSVGAVWMAWEPEFLLVLSRKMVSGVDSYTIMAMPLFMLAGSIMNKAKITDALVDFSHSLVGHIRGGLAQVNIVASIMFAGLTGVAMADVAALGSILIPAMEKDGYGKPFAAAITAASSVIGPIIPPSLVMLIYAHVMGVSVAALFLAGIIPGIMMGLGLMVTTAIISKKRNYPKRGSRPTVRTVTMSLFKSMPALGCPIIILGGIIFGVCTPTEAAALAVLYSFLLGFFFYRTLKFRHLPGIFLSSMVHTSVIFLIIGTASQLGLLITDVSLPQEISEGMLGFTQNKFLMLIIINLFLLLMGMILEIIPNVVLLSPILAPLAIALGVDPIHFALILLVNLNIGMNTPPMGGLLFITASMAGEKFDAVMREMWPFIATQIITLLFITYVPETTLWIPRLFGFL